MQSSSQNCHHEQTNSQLFTGRMPFLSPNQQCQSTDGGEYCCCVMELIYKENQWLFFSHRACAN